MNADKLIKFENETIGEIKGFIDDKTGEPWFLAGKVCDCLKIKNSRDALKGIEERHLRFGDKIKGVGISYVLLKSAGGTQKTTIISEKILYELIFRSNTKKAFEFQQWVYGEVLPSLRKHGEYRMNGKLIRRSLTDTIKDEICDKTDDVNVKRFAYSNFSRLINKSLGLPHNVDRSSLDETMLEKVARKENLVKALIEEGKQYGEIKDFILKG